MTGVRSSDIRLAAADREYRDLADVDDPLAFAVLSMERALEELDKPKRYEVGCLQQAIAVCKRAMDRPEESG